MEVVTPPPSQAPSPPETFTKPADFGCGRWVDAWATSLRPDRPNEYLKTHCTEHATFVGTTVRQTVGVSVATSIIRLRVSNEYGKAVLSLASITAAVPLPESFENNLTTAGSATIDPETICDVTFGGRTSVEIPIGAVILSDPVQLFLTAGSDVSLSLFLPNGQLGDTVTSHLIAKTTTWFTRGGGDCTRSPSLRACPNVASYPGWFLFASIETQPLHAASSTVACFGDSITDRGDSELPMNDYSGWTDVLQFRLQKRSPGSISILNLGISGDRLWDEGFSRFDREVIARVSTGIRVVVVLMGINDLGLIPATPRAQDDLYDRLILAYGQIIAKCHSATPRVAVVVSTLMPFIPPSDDYPPPWPLSHPLREQTRMRINRWIRLKDGDGGVTDGFDHLIDWARVVCEPDNEYVMQGRYQLSDYLHPSVEGCRAMAEAVDLRYLTDPPSAE
jgi:lysophospholipase L1-like esterase